MQDSINAQIQHELTQNPVTALDFYHLDNGWQLLLVGEGLYLKIYNAKDTKLIATCKVFEAQTIHGVAVKRQAPSKLPTDELRVVVWGARSYTLLSHPQIQAIVDGHVQSLITSESFAPDWLLDVAVSSVDGEDACLFVTAHGSVLSLKSYNSIEQPQLQVLVIASQAIYYSAHVVWTSSSSFLLAAGSVFGQVEVSQWRRGFSTSLHTFTGHEGSIFGVQISPSLMSGDGSQIRILASCSDDRTIRLWNLGADDQLSETIAQDTDDVLDRHTGFGDVRETSNRSLSNKRLLAVAMGHVSRIWKVKFLLSAEDNSHVNILSFGEDSTCIQWSLDWEAVADTSIVKMPQTASLNLQQTFDFHSGKHLFSAALACIQSSLDRSCVATGGADGKISLYDVTMKSKHSPSVCVEASQDKNILSTVRSWTLAEITEGFSHTAPILETSIAVLPSSALQNTSVVSVQSPVPAPASALKKKKAKKTPKVLLDSLRAFAFVSHDEFIMITALGRVMIGSIKASGESWKELFLPELEDNPLRSWSIAVGLPDHNAAFFTGSNGTLYVYVSGREIIKVTNLPGRGKVADMLQVSGNNGTPRMLVTYLGCNEVSLLSFDPRVTKCSTSTMETLTLPFGFVATSIGDVAELLVVGSRTGSFAVYDLRRNRQALDVIEAPSNGRPDAITCIMSIPTSTAAPGCTYFIVSNRDGSYAIYLLSRNKGASSEAFRIILVHHSNLLMTTIESVYFQQSELFFSGFRGKSFVVWNETRQLEVLNIPCGGAVHRSYIYQPSMAKIAKGCGTFVYTKGSQLYLLIQNRPSHVVIKSGGHGREIKACDKMAESDLFATAAEDTTIKLYKYGTLPNNKYGEPNMQKNGENRLFCCATIRRHTAGIQVVKFDHRYSDESAIYLYSSGGFEEFYIWALVEIPGFNLGIRLEATLPETLQSADKDLRITSVDVRRPDLLDPTSVSATCDTDKVFQRDITLAYSDSTIKYIHYDSSSGFALKALGRYTAACLTHIETLEINNRLLLLTSSTDGHIVFWELPKPNDHPSETITSENAPEIKMICRHRHHQNAIRSLAMPNTSTSAKTLTILTSSDDNSITLSIYSTQTLLRLSTLSIPSAHSAAITGISFIQPATSRPTSDDQHKPELRSFWSVGIDQILKKWTVEISPAEETGDSMRIKQLGGERQEWERRISTADVAGLVAWTEETNAAGEREDKVLIFGAGMEIFKSKVSLK